MSVFFNGRLITTPTTASVVNDEAMRNRNPAVGNSAVMIGKAQGGKPGALLSFGSPEEARAILRGGDLMRAVVKAFSPSPETGSPSTVYAIRVGTSTQSSLTLQDGSGADVIRLTSQNYGVLDNLLKAKIETGSLSGKRLVIEQGRDRVAQDNIGRELFSVTYTGTEPTATVDVTRDTVSLTAGSGGAISVNLEDVSTIDGLVGRINLETDWEAVVLGNNGEHDTLDAIDAVAAADATGAGTVLRGDNRAILDFLSRSGQTLVDAELVTHGQVLANVGFTSFAGGTDPEVVVEDWQTAFDELQFADVLMVTPLSGDAAVHAMADAHVHYASNVLAKERRAICGTDTGVAFADAEQAAYNINSDRTSLLFQGHYEYDDTGRLRLRPAYMTAAIISAMFASANPGTPMTNKAINCQGLEFDLRNPTDTDRLIKSGILCVEASDQGYKVVKSISTWLIDNKYNRVEQSCGIALDYAVRAVREAVDVLRGQKASPLLVSRAISLTESALTEVSRPEPEGVGALVGDEASPPFRSIQAEVDGDVTRIRFEASPAIPNNYNLVTVFAVPYSGSAAAA